MTDPLTLFVSIGSNLKAATDIAVGLSKLKTMAEVNAKAIELQGAILRLQSDAFAAQAEQSAMIQNVRNLEKEIADVKAWEETKQRYELYQPTAGTFVYALKAECKKTEPAHWICTNCYESGKRSILQLGIKGSENDHYGCPSCKAVIKVRGTSRDIGFA